MFTVVCSVTISKTFFFVVIIRWKLQLLSKLIMDGMVNALQICFSIFIFMQICNCIHTLCEIKMFFEITQFDKWIHTLNNKKITQMLLLPVFFPDFIVHSTLALRHFSTIFIIITIICSVDILYALLLQFNANVSIKNPK